MGIARIVRSLLRRKEEESRIEEELQFHIEQQKAANLAAGMGQDEAQRRAILSVGGVEAAKEEMREQRAAHWMETTLRDLRYGVRGFRRNPAFTLTAVFAIALGIGASTAVFSVVDRILFRPLPYAHADRLVSFGLLAPIETNEFMLGSDYVEWRKAETPFEAITSWSGVTPCDLTDENPMRMSCAQVEASFLPALEVAPIIGRNFGLEEDRPKAPPVALLSYALWRGRFGGDPGIVGKTISLDGQQTRIVGVLPADFELPTLARADLVVPQALDEARQQHPATGRVLRAFARLKPGVTIDEANAQMQPLFAGAMKWVPPQFQREVKFVVRPLRERQIADAKLASWVLLAAVMAVLLIACANVAGLMLARMASRQRELAVRTALGADRRRLVRQTLTESLALGVIGGLAGCAVAEALLKIFVAIAPRGILRLEQASLDGRVLLFAIAASVGSGVLFGLAPALHIPKNALAARTVTGASRQWLRQALVSAQIAISFVLLAGAALLLRSLWKMQVSPLGLSADHVVTAEIALGQQRYARPEQQLAFFEQLEAKLRQVPGVNAVALSDSLPPGGRTRSMIYAAINVEGRPKMPQGTGGMVVWRTVTPEYFAALHVPIIRGRGFSEEDRGSKQEVIILSDALARRMFPGEDAIGKHLQPGNAGPWRTVIGIAADVKNGGLASTADPEYYVVGKRGPADARAQSSVIVRTVLSPQAMSQWIRTTVAQLDPTLPVVVQTMEQRVGTFTERPRFNAAVLALFATMGLLLAAIGLYGLIAFLVAQRTQEIGVRMALGATPGDVLWMMAGTGARLIVAGAAIGLVGALAMVRVLKSFLYDVRPRDPFTFAAVAVGLAAVAMMATYLPARRATRVEPVEALRYE